MENSYQIRCTKEIRKEIQILVKILKDDDETTSEVILRALKNLKGE